MIEPVKIDELIKDGYLSTLRSKFTDHHFSLDDVKKRGGEYIEKDLQLAVNTTKNNEIVVAEIVKHSLDRKSILLFCTGVEHAEHMSELMNSVGIDCEVITGGTNTNERDSIISKFRSGRLRALASVNVLSVGFDAPNVDMIAMLRPTLSPIIYVQQCGRGLRISPNKKDCLVLDFAGNISTHGPITKVKPPRKKGEKQGEAPVKVCENCQEIVHLSAKVCPACNTPFPESVKPKQRLHEDDIMGIDRLHKMRVTSWRWSRHVSKATGKTMLKCIYYGSLSALPVKEYFTIYHDGYAGDKARIKLYDMLKRSGVGFDIMINDVKNVANACNKGTPPV